MVKVTIKIQVSLYIFSTFYRYIMISLKEVYIMFFIPLLFIILIVWLVIVLLRPHSEHYFYNNEPRISTPTKTPLEILNERYARGEISDDDYQRIKRNLQH